MCADWAQRKSGFKRRMTTTATTYLEEVVGGSGFQSSVLDLLLLGEVVDRLDRRQHALDGEERGQVGRVRRDDYQREKPPRAADDPTR